MDAFIEIIEKLVESIPSQSWLEFNHFPFKNNQHLRSHVYDLCLIETNAQGAYGFLFVEFEDMQEILVFPFCLSRYREDGDLISLPPWSLRNATSDSLFYQLWREAQKQKNPLITAKKAFLFYKRHPGEPGIVAVDLWSDTRNSCIRLEFQVVYKIFRTIHRLQAEAVEVDVLAYLGTQSIFQNYAKLTGVLEYSSKEIPLAYVAISMKYIQNNGTLFSRVVALMTKMKSSDEGRTVQEQKKSYAELVKIVESLGRLLGDFHKAMSLAPRNSPLAPESGTGRLRQLWLNSVLSQIEDRLVRVLSLQGQYQHLDWLFQLLPSYVSDLKEKMQVVDDVGLLIRVHGSLHLGQILIGTTDLFILDYDAGDVEDIGPTGFKHPCVHDFVSLLASLRFAWYFNAGKGYSGSIDNDKGESLSTFFNLESQERGNLLSPLSEFEAVFTKFYKNSLDENIHSSGLRPKNFAHEGVVYLFCFVNHLFKEILRECSSENPLTHIWLLILCDHIGGQRR